MSFADVEVDFASTQARKRALAKRAKLLPPQNVDGKSSDDTVKPGSSFCLVECDMRDVDKLSSKLEAEGVDAK